MTWLADSYLWIKAFHIISVIAWMAGMLYLPRLYVYHCHLAPYAFCVNAEQEEKVWRRILLALLNDISFSRSALTLHQHLEHRVH